MKKTQRIDAIRNIKRRIVSWLSIATIMTIGVTGFLGLQSVAYAMKDYGQEYIDEYNLADFVVYSTVGLSEEDLDVIRSLDSVNKVEGIVSIEANVENENGRENLSVFAMNDEVSIALISDGKMPQEVYECALCLDTMEELGISLGDTVTIKRDAGAPSYVIRDGSYIVSGVVDSPEYLTRGVTHYAVFPDEAINVPALGNDYTKAYVDVKHPADADPFAEDYNVHMQPYADEIEGLFDQLTDLENARIEDLKREAEEEGQELPDIPDVRWQVMGRSINNSFIGLTSSYRVLDSVSSYFAPLFILVAFMVCFSTITIIVEEQKTQIGTQKALGMSNGQIRAKYLLFGISATVFGILAGILGAVAMEKVMNHVMADMYLFGEIPIMINERAAKLISISLLIFASVVIFASCNSMVKCSAVGLMNGSEPKPRFSKKEKRVSRKGASIYIGLIFSNIFSDLSRVIVSLIIVLESVMMIGMGFSLNFGLWEAIFEQIVDTWQYEFVVQTDGDEDHMKSVEASLSSMGLASMPVHIEFCQMETTNGDCPVSAYLYATDTDDGRIYDYYEFIDSDNNPVTIPEEGIIVTEGMGDKNGMTDGTEVELVNTELVRGNSLIEDNFVNNIGRYAICSKSGYEKVFGVEAKDNAFLVKSNMEKEELDEEKLEESLWKLNGVRGIYSTVGEIGKYETIIILFDVMVMIIIIMVVMLAFMIQLNLSNIQVNRRMKELLVMRVNGFSMLQVVGYLAREAVLVTGLGIALGIVAGIPFATFMIKQVEMAEFMFDRGPFPVAWIISGILCALFSLIINTIAFGRIKWIPVTDILKY